MDTSSQPVTQKHRETLADQGRVNENFGLTLSDKKDFNINGTGELAKFPAGSQNSDGFIFCSIRAPAHGDRGFVSCIVDGKMVGAASVHNNPECWSPHACLCVPVPRHLPMVLHATASAGKLDIKAWYLASTSQDWKFGKPEPYTVGSYHTAETDGFLNGVVTVREGNAAACSTYSAGQTGIT
jgi:hypothetical protein